MVVIVAGLLALFGVLLCVVRLHGVVAAVYTHPQELGQLVGGCRIDAAAGTRRLPSTALADWDRELLGLLHATAEARQPIVDELLVDLDVRLERWAQAPRTVARVGSIGGFLVASVLVRQAMDAPLRPEETITEAFQGGIVSAIGAVLAGLAVTSLAVAVHGETQRRLRVLRPQFEALVKQVASAHSSGEELS